MELEEQGKSSLPGELASGVPELLRVLWEEPEKPWRSPGGRVKSHWQHRYRLCPLARESYALRKLREAVNGNDLDTGSAFRQMILIEIHCCVQWTGFSVRRTFNVTFPRC
ncbi:ankyrin repeat domain-containing protein 54-like isoform X2 [Phyllobates terribilis]|uniref:ankyrin repeat domain-containing protein 54-like isoform X1 n=1 Tax=Phyllobates terribilis TaxID=111132 RepID=UPI003CCA8AE5